MLILESKWYIGVCKLYNNFQLSVYLPLFTIKHREKIIINYETDKQNSLCEAEFLTFILFMTYYIIIIIILHVSLRFKFCKIRVECLLK